MYPTRNKYKSLICFSWTLSLKKNRIFQIFEKYSGQRSRSVFFAGQKVNQSKFIDFQALDIHWVDLSFCMCQIHVDIAYFNMGTWLNWPFYLLGKWGMLPKCRLKFPNDLLIYDLPSQDKLRAGRIRCHGPYWGCGRIFT